MKRTKVIVNPVSGRGAGGEVVPQIEQFGREHGLDWELVLTERPWQAAELARQAVSDGFESVIAVGGDGTANEVLNGLMLAKQAGEDVGTMGMVSIGRGNDFAFGVGIPAGLEAGLATILKGQTRVIDVGMVVGGLYPKGRYFGNGVGVGFDAVVGFEALKMKRLHGFLSYIVAALKTIFLYYRAPLVRVVYDDNEVVQPCLMVSVMNGRRMGGGFMMAPEARTDDGTFDLCIAAQVSKGKVLALIPEFMKGAQAKDAAIRMGRARRVQVNAIEGVLPAHADGETLCVEGRELSMELLPAQLEVISTPH